VSAPAPHPPSCVSCCVYPVCAVCPFAFCDVRRVLGGRPVCRVLNTFLF
jgi:hypothetical protein